MAVEEVEDTWVEMVEDQMLRLTEGITVQVAEAEEIFRITPMEEMVEQGLYHSQFIQ
jgi:hypothetical protein